MPSHQSPSETDSGTRRPSRQTTPQHIPDTSGTEPEDASSDTEELPLDVVFTLLRNRRRRRALRYLLDEPGPCRLGELAEHIAARENDKSVRAITCYERKRTYVALYQQHLPKLDDADVVDFDADRGTVRVGDTASQLTRYLEDPDAGRSWPLPSPAAGVDRLVVALGDVRRRLVGEG